MKAILWISVVAVLGSSIGIATMMIITTAPTMLLSETPNYIPAKLTSIPNSGTTTVSYAIIEMLLPTSWAATTPSLDISTSQSVYAFGDYLSFTVNILSVSDNTAIFRIIDQEGTKSSDVVMSITDTTSTLTAPFPFMSETFLPGTYTLQVDYSGDTASVEFMLVDSGKVIIPFWIKQHVAQLWIDETLDDTAFLKNLIDNKVVTVSSTTTTTTTGNDNDQNKTPLNVVIPTWYKPTIVLWHNQTISDDEFITSIQYLIDIGVITSTQVVGNTNE